MDIHEAVGEMLKVSEEEMVQASEPMVDQPIADEPAVAEVPQITPELIASLVEQMPELAECDQEQLMRGMTTEVEHIETLGGDIAVVAKLACDHIREFPGQDYYAALEQMKAQLAETPAEEGMPGDEIEPGGAVVEPPRQESPFESVKESDEPEDDEQSAMKKAANKKAEDKINKEEVEK